MQLLQLLNLQSAISKRLALWLMLLAYAVLCSAQVRAQGFIFSDYSKLNNYYNPAFSASDNFMEVNALHRIQSYQDGSQLNATGVELNRPLLNKLKTKRWAGVGLSFTQEQLNNASQYSATNVAASFAYNQQLNSNQFLSFGSQFSFHQQTFGTAENYITGSQWVGNFGYDPSMPIGENFQSLTASYLGVGVGVLWYKIDAFDQQQFYAGFSTFNINQPGYTLVSEEQKVLLLYTAQIGARVLQSMQHSILLEGVSSFDQNKQVYGIGPKWTYHFEDVDPFSPFTSGEFNVFARYYNEGRLSLGTAVAQKHFSFSFSMDFFTQNNRQGLATEFGLSIIKKLHLTKHKKQVATAEGYQIGTERNFETQEQVVLKKEPVDKIASSYQAAKVEGDFSFELSVNFNYGFNETALNEEAKAYLDDIYFMLKANPALRLLVTGHTDNVGSRKANRTVATERAEIVVNYLRNKGIDANRMKADGAGDSEPLLPNSTEENRAKNRRVEFLIFAEKE